MTLSVLLKEIPALLKEVVMSDFGRKKPQQTVLVNGWKMNKITRNKQQILWHVTCRTESICRV